jgi:ACS family tartrate transporter-like MFS transporter
LFLSGTAAAVGIALINAIGNTAGFIGPSLLGAIKTETGGFTLSLYIMASLLACGAVMMLALVPKQQQVASQAPGLHGEAELVDQAMPK